MRPAKDIKQLNFTTEEMAVIQRYREWVQVRREDGRRQPYYVKAKAEYPDLNEETLRELADAGYRKYMSDATRFHQAKKT